MEIKNIEGLSGDQIRRYVAQGGQFVFYTYCISLLVVSLRRSTSIYFIKPGESSVKPGLGPLFISLFLGWWGIPWGPIYTIGAILTACSGGKDVTSEVLAHINQADPTYATSGYNLGGNSSASYSGTEYNISDNNTYNIPR